MESEKSIRIATLISNGIDPETGELIPIATPPAIKGFPFKSADGRVQSEEMERNEDSALQEAIEIITSHSKQRNGSEPQAKLAPLDDMVRGNQTILNALCTVVIGKVLHPRTEVTDGHAFTSIESIAPRGKVSLEDYLNEIEKREILRALGETKFNRTQAARRLGITFRSMRYRMERLELLQGESPEGDVES